MKRQKPENVTTWRSVSYEYTTHDTRSGQIWVFSNVFRALGVDEPDGQRVYVAVEALGETPAEASEYRGESRRIQASELVTRG